MGFKVYFKSDTFSPPTLDILLQCLFLEVLCCARWIPPQTEKTRVPGICVCRVRCWVWLQLRRHSKANQLLKKHGHYVIVIDSNRVNHLKDCVPLTHSMVTPQVPPVQLTPLWRDFSMIFFSSCKSSCDLKKAWTFTRYWHNLESQRFKLFYYLGIQSRVTNDRSNLENLYLRHLRGPTHMGKC